MTLAHPPAAILAEYLMVNVGLLSDPTGVGDNPVFIGYMPDLPGATAGGDLDGKVFAIYDIDGVKDGRTMPDGAHIHRYGVELRVRDPQYLRGWEALQTIEAELQTVGAQWAAYPHVVSLGGESYQLHNVSLTRPALHLGHEQGTKRRHIFSLEMLLTVEQQ